MRDLRIKEIISSFDDPVIRLYSRVRFQIIRQAFIEEIGRHLPESGNILDLGCGFGLFSLYYAGEQEQRRITGVDKNPYRIKIATQAALKLGINNLQYEVADIRNWHTEEKYSAVYALDLVHHLPEDLHADIIKTWRNLLLPGGALIIKDVSTRPFYKKWFTWSLDRMMDWSATVCYRSPEEMGQMLDAAGLEWQSREIWDYLPYPHVIYVAHLKE